MSKLNWIKTEITWNSKRMPFREKNLSCPWWGCWYDLWAHNKMEVFWRLTFRHGLTCYSIQGLLVRKTSRSSLLSANAHTRTCFWLSKIERERELDFAAPLCMLLWSCHLEAIKIWRATNIISSCLKNTVMKIIFFYLKNKLHLSTVADFFSRCQKFHADAVERNYGDWCWYCKDEEQRPVCCGHPVPATWKQ